MKSASPRLVIQVVPPGPGGVRDFADSLAEIWNTQNISSPRLELSEQGTGRPLHAQVQALRDHVGQARDATALPLLVHFSGYGYHPRGLSGWLPRQLFELRRRQSVRVTVYFHELHASGPPWRSAFWLGPLQARAAIDMVKQADAIWTNTRRHADWLLPHTARSHSSAPVVRPVFSTVGEPCSPKPLDARARQAVVFGSQASRERVAQSLRQDSSVLRQLAVSALVEVGMGAPTVRPIREMQTRWTGALAPNEVSNLLVNSRIGLIDYPGQLLAKSSVFAAYAAHGCAVINLRRETAKTSQRSADGLSAGTHFLVGGTNGSWTGAGPQDAVNNAAAWYRQHALTLQAEELLQLVCAT